VKAIKDINTKKPGGWFFDGSITLESLPLLADVQTITTNMSYHQDFWKYLDPHGEHTSVYNRAAHVMGDIDSKSGVELAAINQIKVHLNPCDSHLVEQLKISYVVSTSSVDISCLKLLQVQKSKAFGQLNIYEIENRNAN